MAVFRVERNKDYTVMSNYHLRNKELFLKAKGLLSQADRREENAQSAVSCIERGSERSGENQKERLQYLAAGTEGTATTQVAGRGVVKCIKYILTFRGR